MLWCFATYEETLSQLIKIKGLKQRHSIIPSPFGQLSISARRKKKPQNIFLRGAGSQRIQRWYFYIGHTLFSGIGSWADESQLVAESSDFWDAAPVTGMWVAIADISPVWLSAVIPGRSEVWFMLLSGMVPKPVKCWRTHFRNWFVVLFKIRGKKREGGKTFK